jgi:AhpC/TSA family
VGCGPEARGEGAARRSPREGGRGASHISPAPLGERRTGRVSSPGETAGPRVGDPAPDFTLRTIGLREINLRDFRGKNVVLLFYPLDWTPG